MYVYQREFCDEEVHEVESVLVDFGSIFRWRYGARCKASERRHNY